MNKIHETAINSLKENMYNDDKAGLNRTYKEKNTPFITRSVKLGEVDSFEMEGYEIVKTSSKKAQIRKLKDCGTFFEDNVWCLFKNLGFKILNKNDNLRIQWDANSTCNQQIDVVAVGDDAIFVVECKASKGPERKKVSFKKELNNMKLYMPGVTKVLQKAYGENKRVKFIFATRNYIISEDSEDKTRMKEYGIYHMDENSYNYISNLIKSYKEAVVYQFYGLMFKNELINEQMYTIPALRGKMGGHDYYLFSIEPSILLKIGFILHRTKVNDSMAPTYQRLLVPSRLNGITAFIDKKSGFFPNSIILNFEKYNENLGVLFKPFNVVSGSNAECGMLQIPNAYGFAYIIDGQHRVYGYANSKQKDKCTIPVVAFDGMNSSEQLQIFMDINEHQKAVSPSLRLDLEEDLHWKDERIDSRMSALRSSIIKNLSRDTSSVLFNKISIGEDKSDLTFAPFSNALSNSGLVPAGKQTHFCGDNEGCIYDFNETESEKAMLKARKEISSFLIKSYNYLEELLDNDKKDKFLFSNRATYAIIVLIGSLHKHLIVSGKITKSEDIVNRVEKLKPYLKSLCDGLNNLPEEQSAEIKGIQGKQAESVWLHHYQNLVNIKHNDYQPESLMKWRETLNKDIQLAGEELVKQILDLLHTTVWYNLRECYGDDYLRKLFYVQRECEDKIIKVYGDQDGFELKNYNWEDELCIVHYKDIISENFCRQEFMNNYSIDIGEGIRTKKEKLQWLVFCDKASNPQNKFTSAINGKLEIIREHLNNIIQ